MNETSNQVHEMHDETMDENDPLLELARIVSGEDIESRPEPTHPDTAKSENPDIPFAQNLIQSSDAAQDFASVLRHDLDVQVPSTDNIMPDAVVSEPAPAPIPTEPVAPIAEIPAQPVPATPELPAETTKQVEQFVPPAAEPQFVPPIAEPQFVAKAISPTADSFEASLEDQLMQELDANISEADQTISPFAEILDSVPGTLPAGVSVEEPTLAPQIQQPVAAPQDVAQPENASPVVEHAQTIVSSVSPDEAIPDLPAAPAEDVQSTADEDLGDMFAAEFEQINAQYAAPEGAAEAASTASRPVVENPVIENTGELSFLDVDPSVGSAPVGSEVEAFQEPEVDVNGTYETVDDGINLESEFESAFAAELIENDILPLTESLGNEAWNDTTTQDAQMEFAAAVPGEHPHLDDGIENIPSEPEHLTDPALLDEPATPYMPDQTNDGGSRSGIKMAALALGVALFAGLGAVSYGYFTSGPSSDQPILVKADSDPIKVKPADPGGKVIANQENASYQKVAGKSEEANQEKLVSATEIAKPVNVGKQVETLQPKTLERLKPGTKIQPTLQAAMAPRKVKTFTVKPDGTIIAPEPVAVPQPTGETLLTALQPEPVEVVSPVNPRLP